MRKKRLLTLIGSICLILVLAALLLPACAPKVVEAPELEAKIKALEGELTSEKAEVSRLEKELAEAAVPAKVYEWVISDFAPPTDILSRANIHFGNLLEGMSDGRIHVKYYGSSTLGDVEEICDSVMAGEVEFGDLSPYSGIHELQDVKGLPFAGTNVEGIDKLFFGEGVIGKIIDDSWELVGVKRILRLEHGIMAYINNQHPIATPDEMAGLKFRVPPSNVYVETFKRMAPKAVGEAIAWGEVYTSLERGVVDGSVNYMGSYRDEKHYEVAKYYTDVNQMYNWNDLVMNLAIWNSLPEDIKDIVLAARVPAQDYTRFRYRAECAEIEEDLTTLGCEFTHLTPEQRQAFVDNVKPFELYEELYKDLLEKYYPGENMYQRLVNEVKAAG